jgi:hypothetical protein
MAFLILTFACIFCVVPQRGDCPSSYRGSLHLSIIWNAGTNIILFDPGWELLEDLPLIRATGRAPSSELKRFQAAAPHLGNCSKPLFGREDVPAPFP